MFRGWYQGLSLFQHLLSVFETSSCESWLDLQGKPEHSDSFNTDTIFPPLCHNRAYCRNEFAAQMLELQNVKRQSVSLYVPPTRRTNLAAPVYPLSLRLLSPLLFLLTETTLPCMLLSPSLRLPS